MPGKLDTANSDYVLKTLRYATAGCSSGIFDALVTAPVHKGIIVEAGIPFTGHTEFLAEMTGSDVVMMLVGSNMRVALATTHLPLRSVADAITFEQLEQKLRIIHHDLHARFLIDKPCIAVAGLNPHAGESGHLGREEIDIIIPVLDKLRNEGMNLVGPLRLIRCLIQRACSITIVFLRCIMIKGCQYSNMQALARGQRDIRSAHYPYLSRSRHCT